MKKTLELVKGAVSDKDLLPIMTHFHIYEGRVQGSNGGLAIDAPCPELAGIDCTVPAEKFLRAIEICNSDPKIKLTEGGKLTVTHGKFRAILPLAVHDTFPRATPGDTGASITLTAPLLPVLRRLYPFINTDRSRAWMCGVLLRDGYAWATNNVCLARVPYVMEEIVIHTAAIDELLRIGLEPERITHGETWITFYFNGGQWLRAQKINGDWPDVAKGIPTEQSKELVPAHELIDAVRRIIPFCPDPKFPVIKTNKRTVSTLDGEMSASMGCSITLPEALFRADTLVTVLEVAINVNLSTYPKACYWSGDNIDGVIVGVRI